MAIALVLAFFTGYFASIYSWPKVKIWVNGAETEIRSFEDKLKALKAKI